MSDELREQTKNIESLRLRAAGRQKKTRTH